MGREQSSVCEKSRQEETEKWMGKGVGGKKS